MREGPPGVSLSDWLALWARIRGDPRLLRDRPADGKRSGCDAVVCIANCSGAGVLRSCPYAVVLPSYADWGVTSGGDFTFLEIRWGVRRGEKGREAI